MNPTPTTRADDGADSTPTPRTDDRAMTVNEAFASDDDALFVRIDFARQLERELNEWKEMAERLDKKCIDEQRDHVKTCGYHDATKAELATCQAQRRAMEEILREVLRTHEPCTSCGNQFYLDAESIAAKARELLAREQPARPGTQI